MSIAKELLEKLKTEIDTYELQLIFKNEEIENLKLIIAKNELTIAELNLKLDDIVTPPAPTTKTVIDDKLTTITDKWGKTHYGKTVNYSNIILKNSQGWYFNGCDVVLENCEFENIYAVIFDQCKSVRIINPKMTRTKRAFDIRKTLNGRIEGFYEVSYTQDFPIPNDPNLNGDGIISDPDSNGWFIDKMYSHHNADCGLDWKGSNLTVNYLKSEFNKHGTKQWGKNNHILTLEANDNKSISIFQINGSLTVDNLISNRPGEHHIMQGLRQSYTQGWSKTLTIPKATVDAKSLIYQDKSWGPCSATINGKIY